MFRKLATLASSTVVSLIVAEVVLHALLPAPLSFESPQVRYIPHDTRRFTLAPGQERAFSYSGAVTVGADGFRQVPARPEMAEAIPVIGIGDSFTFGLGVADDETWPARLQVHLNQKAAEPFRVTNAGVISYGVSQSLDLLNEHGQSLQPRVVIHGLYWNDYMGSGPTRPNPTSVLTADGYFLWDPPPPDSGLGRIKVWLRGHSLLAYLGSSLAQGILGAVTGSGVTDYEQEYRALVRGRIEPERWMPVEDFYRQLKEKGEADGFEVYSVIMPVLGIVESGQGASHPYAIQMRAMLERLGIQYLDGVGLWQERDLGPETFLPYNRHLNAAGYEALADAIWEDIANIAR